MIVNIWTFRIFLTLCADTTCRLPNTLIRTHLDLLITKGKDTFCISDHVDKYFISEPSFAHLEMGVNKQQAVRRAIRARRMRVFEGEKIKNELDEKVEVNKGESSIDNTVGIYNDRVKALFDRIFER